MQYRYSREKKVRRINIIIQVTNYTKIGEISHIITSEDIKFTLNNLINRPY